MIIMFFVSKDWDLGEDTKLFVDGHDTSLKENWHKMFDESARFNI